eukprot:13150473-Ditylum_brightwellii.AAC.1
MSGWRLETSKLGDIVQGPEREQKKKYFGDPSILGSDITIPSHNSEVLYQVEGSNIPAGGWVGGDSWFGNITTSVEVYKKFK